MGDQCEVQRIQQNSAENALEQARTAHLNCLPLDKRIDYAMNASKSDFSISTNEAQQLNFMSNFLLKQLERETGSNQTLGTMQTLAAESTTNMKKEIEDLKAKIRMERRLFMDSGPQDGIGGLYFASVPDNQVLIAFLVTFGTFWLILGLVVIFGLVDVRYIQDMTMGERVGIVGGSWLGIAVFTVGTLFAFT